MPAGSLASRTTVTAVAPGNMYSASTKGAIYTDLNLVAYNSGSAGDGRGIVVTGTACHISNVWVHVGDDEGLTLVEGATGTVVSQCKTMIDDYSLFLGHGLFCGAASGASPLIDVRAKDGYAGVFTGCDIGGAARITGGVWRFQDCTIQVDALYGIDAYGAQIDFVRCNFVTRSQPAGAPYWYLPSGGCPVRVSGYAGSGGAITTTNINTRLYFKGCTLNGAAAYGRELCRLYNASTGYDAALSVPLYVFRTTPNE